MKIFGREPTLVLEAIGAILTIVATFWADKLSAEQAGLYVAIGAAVLGAINAVTVRPVAPAAFKMVVTTVAALLTTYGLDFSQEQIGAVQLGVVAVVTLLTRAQVTPSVDPLPIGSESVKTIEGATSGSLR